MMQLKHVLVVVMLSAFAGIGSFGTTFRQLDPLPALDAHGFNGVQEITRPELVKLMAKFQPLSKEENADLDRGCPGLACLYQRLGPKNVARVSARHCRLS